MTKCRTSRHIHAVRLMLPKIPDRASFGPGGEKEAEEPNKDIIAAVPLTLSPRMLNSNRVPERAFTKQKSARNRRKTRRASVNLEKDNREIAEASLRGRVSWCHEGEEVGEDRGHTDGCADAGGRKRSESSIHPLWKVTVGG